MPGTSGIRPWCSNRLPKSGSHPAGRQSPESEIPAVRRRLALGGIGQVNRKRRVRLPSRQAGKQSPRGACGFSHSAARVRTFAHLCVHSGGPAATKINTKRPVLPALCPARRRKQAGKDAKPRIPRLLSSAPRRSRLRSGRSESWPGEERCHLDLSASYFTSAVASTGESQP